MWALRRVIELKLYETFSFEALNNQNLLKLKRMMKTVKLLFLTVSESQQICLAGHWTLLHHLQQSPDVRHGWPCRPATHSLCGSRQSDMSAISELRVRWRLLSNGSSAFLQLVVSLSRHHSFVREAHFLENLPPGPSSIAKCCEVGRNKMSEEWQTWIRKQTEPP